MAETMNSVPSLTAIVFAPVYNITPANADNPEVEFYSSDTDIALIEDYSDTVITLKAGTCKIYVVTEENGLTDYIDLTVLPASGSCGDNATWSYTDGVLTITGSGEITDFTSDEARPWNGYLSSIRSVVINSGITRIGELSFDGLNALTLVSIPDTVTYIAYRSFADCNALQTISLPNALTGIGSECFYGCTELTGITIPDSVNWIGYSAFRSCSSLTNLTLPSSLSVINYDCFDGCTNLQTVVIREGVTTIGYRAFEDCHSLTSIVIPSSVTAIDVETYGDQGTNPAFTRCSNVKFLCYDESAALNYAKEKGIPYTLMDSPLRNPDFTIPASVTVIETESFSGIAAKRIRLGEQVIRIEANAFSNCPNLKMIYIPECCENIDITAFSGVTGLTIYGSDDSYAQWFAGRRGFTFVVVE